MMSPILLCFHRSVLLSLARCCWLLLLCYLFYCSWWCFSEQQRESVNQGTRRKRPQEPAPRRAKTNLLDASSTTTHAYYIRRLLIPYIQSRTAGGQHRTHRVGILYKQTNKTRHSRNEERTAGRRAVRFVSVPLDDSPPRRQLDIRTASTAAAAAAAIVAWVVQAAAQALSPAIWHLNTQSCCACLIKDSAESCAVCLLCVCCVCKPIWIPGVHVRTMFGCAKETDRLHTRTVGS